MDQDLNTLLKGSQVIEFSSLFQSNLYRHILIVILIGYLNLEISLGCSICKHNSILYCDMKAILSHL
jgi:hypothetical protein